MNKNPSLTFCINKTNQTAHKKCKWHFNLFKDILCLKSH